MVHQCSQSQNILFLPFSKFNYLRCQQFRIGISYSQLKSVLLTYMLHFHEKLKQTYLVITTYIALACSKLLRKGYFWKIAEMSWRVEKISLHLIQYDRSTKSVITLAFPSLGFFISAWITLLCASNNDSSSPAHLVGAELEACTCFNINELSEAYYMYLKDVPSFFF